MCEPDRLARLYRAVLEHGLGLSAHIADDNSTVTFTQNHLQFVVRNTADEMSELLDVTVRLRGDEVANDVKQQTCESVSTIPCIKAWVDTRGDVVVNGQALAGPPGLMPPSTMLLDILPRLIHLVRLGADQIITDMTLAGITIATESSKGPSTPAP